MSAQRRRAIGGLVLAVVVAVGLSAWSLNFGLPYLFRPDEDTVVGRAVGMAAHANLDWHFYNYPPLVFMLLAAVERLGQLLGLGTLAGAAGPDPSAAYLAARLVSAAAAGVAAAGTFLAGRRAYGTGAGLLAALALAAAPLSVRQAHFATTDEVQMALVAVCLWASMEARTARGFAVAGALAGLAAATKYTGGAVLIVPLVLAAYRPERSRLMPAAAAVAALAFLLPFGLAWNFGAIAAGIHYLAGSAGGRRSGPSGLVYNLTVTLPFGWGLGATMAAVAGLGAAIWRRLPADMALVALVIAFLASTSTTHPLFFRYLLPALPALALLSARWLALVPPGRTAAAAAAFGLLLIPSIYASAMTDRLLGVTDTRVLAGRWLLAHEPPGTALRQTNYFSEVFYGPQDMAGNPLHSLYVTHDRLVDSYQLGLYTNRFDINGTGAVVVVLESGPPAQAPLPAAPAGSRTLAVFESTDGGPTGIYDPDDAFFLPIWGFSNTERPGPAIRIVECAPPCPSR